METSQTRPLSQINVNEYQTRLVETQKLHIKACQETTSLKEQLDELKTQLKIQQRRLEYKARKNMLEEHKTALMLLRGQRIADGGCTFGIRNLPGVDNGQTHVRCRSLDLPEVTSSGDSSPEVTSPAVKSLPGYAPLRVEKVDLNFERVRTEAISVTKTASSPEVIPAPEVPVTISVATSTDDLDEMAMEADVAFRNENKQGGEENNWNIQENMLRREEAEGRSRSVSPYTAEKRSYAKGEIIYSLAEEVREIPISSHSV